MRRYICTNTQGQLDCGSARPTPAGGFDRASASVCSKWFCSVSEMRFGIYLAQQRMEWDELLARARLCEKLGFEGLWGFDHLV